MKIEDCRLSKMTYDFIQKGTKFEFFCYGDITPNLESYTDKKIVLELKSEKRSLGANRVSVGAFGRATRKTKNTKRRNIQTIHIWVWFIRCLLHEK